MGGTGFGLSPLFPYGIPDFMRRRLSRHYYLVGLAFCLIGFGASGQTNIPPVPDFTPPEGATDNGVWFLSGLGLGFFYGGTAWAFRAVRQIGKGGGYDL